MVLLLAACSDGLVYNHSVDVHPDGWAPTDTLFFPIHVDEETRPGRLLEVNIPYCLGMVVRYERYYPTSTIQVYAQMDNEEPYEINLPLGNLRDMPDDDQSGSVCIKEFNDLSPYFVFPDTGFYQLKVWPDTITDHILSMIVTLE